MNANRTRKNSRSLPSDMATVLYGTLFVHDSHDLCTNVYNYTCPTPSLVLLAVRLGSAPKCRRNARPNGFDPSVRYPEWTPSTFCTEIDRITFTRKHTTSVLPNLTFFRPRHRRPRRKPNFFSPKSKFDDPPRAIGFLLAAVKHTNVSRESRE